MSTDVEEPDQVILNVEWDRVRESTGGWTDDDRAVFDGLRAHVSRLAQDEKMGLIRKPLVKLFNRIVTDINERKDEGSRAFALKNLNDFGQLLGAVEIEDAEKKKSALINYERGILAALGIKGDKNAQSDASNPDTFEEFFIGISEAKERQAQEQEQKHNATNVGSGDPTAEFAAWFSKQSEEDLLEYREELDQIESLGLSIEQHDKAYQDANARLTEYLNNHPELDNSDLLHVDPGYLELSKELTEVSQGRYAASQLLKESMHNLLQKVNQSKEGKDPSLDESERGIPEGPDIDSVVVDSDGIYAEPKPGTPEYEVFLEFVSLLNKGEHPKDLLNKYSRNPAKPNYNAHYKPEDLYAAIDRTVHESWLLGDKETLKIDGTKVNPHEYKAVIRLLTDGGESPEHLVAVLKYPKEMVDAASRQARREAQAEIDRLEKLRDKKDNFDAERILPKENPSNEHVLFNSDIEAVGEFHNVAASQTAQYMNVMMFLNGFQHADEALGGQDPEVKAFLQRRPDTAAMGDSYRMWRNELLANMHPFAGEHIEGGTKDIEIPYVPPDVPGWWDRSDSKINITNTEIIENGELKELVRLNSLLESTGKNGILKDIRALDKDNLKRIPRGNDLGSFKTEIDIAEFGASCRDVVNYANQHANTKAEMVMHSLRKMQGGSSVAMQACYAYMQLQASAPVDNALGEVKRRWDIDSAMALNDATIALQVWTNNKNGTGLEKIGSSEEMKNVLEKWSEILKSEKKLGDFRDLVGKLAAATPDNQQHFNSVFRNKDVANTFNTSEITLIKALGTEFEATYNRMVGEDRQTMWQAINTRLKWVNPDNPKRLSADAAYGIFSTFAVATLNEERKKVAATIKETVHEKLDLLKDHAKAVDDRREAVVGQREQKANTKRTHDERQAREVTSAALEHANPIQNVLGKGSTDGLNLVSV